MREQFQEILATISRNKLRTFLTGFSVAWGIFMLVILLGAGNGLQNGVQSNFADMATNQGAAYGGLTSIPYGGYQTNRRIHIRLNDKEELKASNPKITEVAGYYSIGMKTITYNKEYTTIALQGVETLYETTSGVKIVEGRFINQNDVANLRKVIVLEENCVNILSPDKSLIGEDVLVDRMLYKVIGIYKTRFTGYNSIALVPLSTIQLLYTGGDDIVHNLRYLIEGVNTLPESEAFNQEVRETLAAKHTVDPNDRQAIGTYNAVAEFLMINKVFGGISVFIWIIGLGTLLAGVVGVSNIMLVTVRERTSEFGIRKSMGATPGSLVRLVLVESVFITALFGYIGMMLGVGVMEIFNIFLERDVAANPTQNVIIFLNPTLNLSVVFSATMTLIIAGVIAGYIPARRAARLKTIDAMRYNK